MYQMDPRGIPDPGRSRSVSCYEVKVGDIVGTSYCVIGIKIYLYASPNHDDAIPMLLGEIQEVLLQRYMADKSSLPATDRFTIKDGDGKDVMHEFQRDLINCGFRGNDIGRHYDELRKHLHELRRSFNDKSLDITILQVNACSGQTSRPGETPKPRKVSVHLERQQDGPRPGGDQTKPKINQNTHRPLPRRPKRYNINSNIVEVGDSAQDYSSGPEVRRQRERRTRQPQFRSESPSGWSSATTAGLGSTTKETQPQFRSESPSGWSSATTAGSRPTTKEHQRPFVHNYKTQASPEQGRPTMPGQFPDPLIDPNYAMYATFQRVPGSYIPPQNGYFPPQAYYNHTYQTTPVPPPYFQAPPAPHQRYAYGASFQYPYSPPYSPYQNHFPIPKNDPNTPQPTNQPFQNDFNHPHPHPTPTPTQPLLQLTYEKLPQKDLHHPLDLPVLPEGWDWRLDNANRIFYVDTYAHGHEKRCFWKPPIEEPEEEEDGSCLPPGWERTCTIYGRVFWTHVRSRIVSYEFPGSCPQFKYSSVGELYLGEDVEREGVQWRHWSSVDLGLFWVDDSEVACRISRDVWQDGISDEAVKARGELWWGNSKFWEWKLRLSVWCRPLVDVSLDGNGSQSPCVEDPDGLDSDTATCDSFKESKMYMVSNYQRASVEDVTEEEADNEHRRPTG